MTRRGSAPKPSRILDEEEVFYSKSNWKLLSRMRETATQTIMSLGSWQHSAFVHGSLARGDVDEKSDVDVVIPLTVNTQMIEARLGLAGIEPTAREIEQATPKHSPKARMFLDPEQRVSVTIPLSPFRTLEEQFYVYGGKASIGELGRNVRMKGCTKRLTLIEPVETGHREWSIIGRETEAALALGIKPDIVRERLRVLSRRDEVGRTGIFLTIAVPPSTSFEEALLEETKSNPALRRTLRARR